MVYKCKVSSELLICQRQTWEWDVIIIVIVIIIIIIVTRPKPAYGRQGLAGSWGQDTDQAGTFWGVLNVSLRASGAQLRLKPKKNLENPTWRLENDGNQPAIVKHHKNPPGTIVAFVWFFSSVSPQIACMNRCKVALVAFLWLVCINKWLLKLLAREEEYSHWSHFSSSFFYQKKCSFLRQIVNCLSFPRNCFFSISNFHFSHSLKLNIHVSKHHPWSECKLLQTCEQPLLHKRIT